MAAKPTAFISWPVGGIPGGEATRFLRADFRTEGEDSTSSFESLIETKCPRLVWSRATLCSCASLSGETSQADPACPVCNGLGWRYFSPKGYVVNSAALGDLDPLQAAIRVRQRGVVIRGLVVGLTVQPDIFQALGSWSFGSAMLTVRPANRLGYYDRIVQLDEIGVYSEVVDVSGNNLKTRYPVRGVNFIASLTKEFTDEDVALSDDGVLSWRAGKSPGDGERVTVHYMHHPTWVVLEYANHNRTSLNLFRKAKPQTPQGDTLNLPIRVIIRKEHLKLDPPED